MNPKLKAILIGMAAGALLGAAFGWVFGDGQEHEETRVGLAKLGPADYIKLGISVLTLAREFGSMMRRT